ncbi:MAG: cytochrome C oxidase subunit II [Betaproteobacteria bacterium]|nr:cytochrome C oxidase subunit II [Betaproteobacteria bacterium]
MQNLAWALSLILMAVVAAVFLWVVKGASRPGGDGGAIARTAFQWRDRLFWLVIAAGAAISFATLREWPIAGHAATAAKPDVVIRATGHQFRWQLERDTVRAGQLVEFELTSADVNHGFAIYKDKNTLVAQTQAMPGYVNKLQVRFTEPGDYEVLCLEYCGIAHHNMRAVIKVRAGS